MSCTLATFNVTKSVMLQSIEIKKELDEKCKKIEKIEEFKYLILN